MAYSANKRRVGPCTSSYSGDKDDLNEEGKCAEDYAQSTSKSDQGGLDNALQEAASEKPTGQNNLELHPRQNPLKASAEVSMTSSKRKRAPPAYKALIEKARSILRRDEWTVTLKYKPRSTNRAAD
ncbi:hypothetical protein V2J09_014029 [Rumex salicifolius]